MFQEQPMQVTLGGGALSAALGCDKRMQEAQYYPNASKDCTIRDRLSVKIKDLEMQISSLRKEYDRLQDLEIRLEAAKLLDLSVGTLNSILRG
jgi:hypothetical protein